MQGLKVSMHHVFFVSGLTLALGAGTAGLSAQQYPATNPTTVNGQATASVRTEQNPNADLTQAEVARMDQFLDDHKNIENDLDKNPSLVNDTKYLDHHKDLDSFLGANPRLRAELAENPRYFMSRENRFEAREGVEAGANTRSTGQPSGANDNQNQRNPNPDLRNGEVVNFDGFLDSHPDISRQLEANPALINDSNYLQANPALQSYLTQHPQVRVEISETPNYFMQRENRLEAREENRAAPGAQNLNARQMEEARMDQYLSDHKDVDRDVRKNPRLVNDSDYLKHHRDFDQFLRANPDLRADIGSNPNYFQDRDRDRFAFNAEGNARVDADASGDRMSKEQSARVDQFLDKHQKIAKDLDHNPDLCNDQKYLNHHKDLRDFFAKNPDIHRELAQNRSYFEARQQRFEQHGAVPTTKPADKPTSATPQQTKPTPPAKPATPPVDQRQNMTPNTAH